MKKSTYWRIAPFGIIGLGLLFRVFINPSDPPNAALFIGRFHSMVVHFPIGLLLLAVLLEVLARKPRFGHFSSTIKLLLLAGAAGAVAAVLAGLYLEMAPGYEADTLFWHKRLGIGIAILSFIAYGFRLLEGQPGTTIYRIYVGVLVVLCSFVTVGGHLGSVLTHGSGYLTRYMPQAFRSVLGLGSPAQGWVIRLATAEDAGVYSDLVQPIFDSRCVSCHNADQQRGQLALDTPEGIEEGGDDGPILVAGRSSESEIMRRILLPPDHEDHMPPEGKPPLTVAEATLIRWWIDEGASFDQKVAEATQPPLVEQIFAGLELPERKTGIFALEIAAADSTAIQAARATNLIVAPLAENEPFLQVRCPLASDCLTAEQVTALSLIASQVAWLNLGRTAVGDSALAVLATLPHLSRLHLESTSVSDEALFHLSNAQYLEYLNLYDTSVSDSGLQHLSTLPSLRSLFLWETEVTSEGVERLQQALPDAEIVLGWTLPSVDRDTTSAP